MKILLTGGGSGGHFYPIIAVAQSINTLAREHKLVDIQLFYMAPQAYDERLLYENNITFIKNTAGKIRRYFSILNFFDIFRTIVGTIRAIWQIYWLYPDVIFGKGRLCQFPSAFCRLVFTNSSRDS
jgi:UDP-N-acetylglucosamine--N-acetylmuramyl-(pentapeptide) pyrophosphoryl-undecaprenol N-acetylglucosamine transferase